MMDLLDKCSPSLQAEVWSGKNLAVFFIKKDNFCELIYSEKAIKFCEILIGSTYVGQIISEDFAKFCGLLRIHI